MPRHRLLIATSSPRRSSNATCASSATCCSSAVSSRLTVTALSESSYPANGDLVSSSDSAPPAPVGSEQTPRAPRMPPYRRLNARERTSLLVEILSSYIQARKALRDEPIERAVATLRQHPGSGDPSGANTQTLIEAHRLARAVQRTLTL